MMLFGLNSFSFSGEGASIFSPSFSVAFLSNGLNLTGLIYYFYLMFRGYGVLPFIRKPHRLLMFVPPGIIGLVFLTMIKGNSWNMLLKFTII